MLPLSEWLDLLAFEPGGGAVLSAYVEPAGPSPAGREFEAAFREPRGGGPSPAGLEEDAARMRRFLAEEFDGRGWRSAAMFSCRGRGLWLGLGLPEPVRSEVRAGPRPYLAPLANVLQQYRRFGALLVDSEAARFLEAHLGALHEFRAGSAAAPRTGPRAADALDSHLRAAADRLMELTRLRGFDRVILGAPPSLEPLAASHLHTFIQENLIVDHSLGPRSADAEVLERVMAGERESRRVRESVLVFRLMDAVRDGGRAVAGLEETLRCLERGLVRKLVVRDGLAKLGRACGGCGALSLRDRRCRGCARPMEPVLNVVPELERRALEQGCEVVRILYDRRLDGAGSIGAELRARNEPAGA